MLSSRIDPDAIITLLMSKGPARFAASICDGHEKRSLRGRIPFAVGPASIPPVNFDSFVDKRSRIQQRTKSFGALRK